MIIRALEPTDAEACDRVIASLPYFFGDPEGIADAATAVRAEPGWVAEEDGSIVGFVTLATRFPESVEITWLAVDGHRRRSSVGRRLVERAADASAAGGARALCVLTLGPSVPEPDVDDGYEGTRRFYRRLGFVPIKELDLTAWSGESALLLVRNLGADRERS